MSETPGLETPLHYLRGSHHGSVDEFAGLAIVEAAWCRHLSIRGHAESPVVAEAILSLTGLALPTQPLSCQSNASARIFWQGPSEWMLVVDDQGSESIESDLRQALAGEHAAVVDVSGGQTLLTLSGPALSQVLQKSSPYDFHPHNFPPGKCVQTTFGKAGALVAQLEENTVTLLVRRSFSDYIGKWLLDAAAEYGVRISD